jgi:hypothetical protein
MKEKEITGEVIYDEELEEWFFQTDNEEVYSGDVLEIIDTLLDRETKAGEKFKITIEKL